MDFLFFDFEYVNSQEKNLDVICCAVSENGGPIESYWLHDGSDNQRLIDRLSSFNGYLVSYNVAAEARGLIALGLDPLNFKWLDLMVEWKLLQNHTDEFNYGCYFDKWGNKRFSDPGVRDSEMKRVNQTDPTPIGRGLTDCVGRLLEINLDKTYKAGTIDLILTRNRDAIYEGKKFDDVEKQQILEYCESDIHHLENLLSAIIKHELRLFGLSLDSELLPAMMERARFNVCMALLEMEGFPMDMKKINNLTKNYAEISENCYKAVNEIYPIFVQTVKADIKAGFKKQVISHIDKNLPDWPRTTTGKPELKASTIGQNYDKLPKLWLGPLFKGKWTKKVARIVEMIDSKGIAWPRTEKGAYKLDEKTLKEHSYIPEIEILRENLKILTQIRWFRPKAIPELEAKIGVDNQLRPYFNPFGAQSGRSQPPAKSYPFLWSSWLRCAVRAKPGMTMISADFASQEFIVAAALSNDDSMIKAYDSKDPYLYFAKLAGAVPWDGTKQEYGKERDLFKAIVLGLQYGLGVKKLSIQLTHQMKREVTWQETNELVNKHKQAFPTFWNWAADIDYHYFERNNPIIMGHNMSDLYSEESKGDLWCVGIDNPNPLSIKNVPVQGISASIMRRAVIKFCERKVPIFSTLHDGFYFHVPTEEVDKWIKAIEECCSEACMEIIGRDIRLDIELYGHDDLYVPAKGKKLFEKFKSYILAE